MREPRFRAASRDDWPALAALLEECGLPVAGAEDHLESFVLAERAGTILGMAGLEIHERHGLLRSVAVRATERGSGLGRRLVEALVDLARSRGLETVSLLTTTADTYFPRFGFTRIDRSAVPEPVKRSAEFQGACPDTAIAMIRR